MRDMHILVSENGIVSFPMTVSALTSAVVMQKSTLHMIVWCQIIAGQFFLTFSSVVVINVEILDHVVHDLAHLTLLQFAFLDAVWMSHSGTLN